LKLNQEHIKKLIALVNQSPFFQLLSMTIQDMGVGFSKLHIEMEHKHLSPYMAYREGFMQLSLMQQLTGLSMPNCRKRRV